MLNQFIKQLSVDLGLPETLAPNDDGSYSVLFDPDLEISLRENPDSGITMMTALAPLREEDAEAFLHKALTANLFGRETGGGVLGLDQEGKHLVFSSSVFEGQSYKEFHDALEDFVNYAEAWRVEAKQEDERQENL